MFLRKPVTTLALAVITTALLLSAGCAKTQTPSANPSPEVNVPTAAVSTATATLEPTPTEIPAAAIVNGEPIPLNYFNNEVWRYRDSLATKAGTFSLFKKSHTACTTWRARVSVKSKPQRPRTPEVPKRRYLRS
jgi:hypothetical protein